MSEGRIGKMNTAPRTADLPQRFHPRVDANFMVKLIVDGRAILAKARDLSMAGLYLIGEFGCVDHTLTLCIPLPRDREIVTRCRIKRWHPDGLAVEFEQLDWDDLFALARYLHPRLR
ncbi:MAG TPA: PilZ domain-containing protein [Myxococcaceae bacterium]|nr:PilZ domain-containing protein [Myxococcaceae bacterium]